MDIGTALGNAKIGKKIARARLKLSSGSFMSKVGAHLSPYMTDFYNNVSDTFSGKFTPEKGLAGLDLIYFGDKNTPDPFRDWMRSKWKKYFASPIDKNPMGDWKGDPGQDPMGDFIPSVKSGGDPSGISVSGSAPKDQTITLDINISGAPKGTTVTVPPNQPVKVRPTINHMGFDQ